MLVRDEYFHFEKPISPKTLQNYSFNVISILEKFQATLRVVESLVATPTQDGGDNSTNVMA